MIAIDDRLDDLIGDADPAGAAHSRRPVRDFFRGVSGSYGSYVDEPLVMVTDTDSDGLDERYFCHSNHLYSVSALTDTTGAVVERYGYDAYGERIVLDSSGTTELAGSTVGQPYGFTGRRLDVETGLWYFRARYYDGELGRFVGRDPLGYVDGMSMYRGGHVPNFVDPRGLCPCDVGDVSIHVGEFEIVGVEAVVTALPANPEDTTFDLGEDSEEDFGPVRRNLSRRYRRAAASGARLLGRRMGLGGVSVAFNIVDIEISVVVSGEYICYRCVSDDCCPTGKGIWEEVDSGEFEEVAVQVAATIVGGGGAWIEPEKGIDDTDVQNMQLAAGRLADQLEEFDRLDLLTRLRSEVSSIYCNP